MTKMVMMTALLSSAMPMTFAAEAVAEKDSQLTDDQFSEPVRTTETPAAEPAARTTKDVVPSHYRDKYASGNGTCGDFIATEISAVTKDSGKAGLNAIKAENGINAGRWDSLNNGMQRMNLANTLRATFLRGDVITINGREHSLAGYLAEFEGEGDEREPINLQDAKEVGKFIKMVDLQDTDRTRNAILKALGPKPEKKAVKTAEERAAEKAQKAAEAEAERAKKKAERDAEAAKKKEEREAEAKKRDEEKAKAKAEREAEAAKKKEEREKAEAEKKAERERIAAEKKAEKEKAAKAKADADAKAAKPATKTA